MKDVCLFQADLLPKRYNINEYHIYLDFKKEELKKKMLQYKVRY